MNDVIQILSQILSFVDSNSGELITGVIGILGAVVGGKLSEQSAMCQERFNALRDAYVDVFAGYYAYMMENSNKNILDLVIAMERTMLICSKKSTEIIKEILSELSKEPRDIQKLGNKICQLRESAAKDLEERQRK